MIHYKKNYIGDIVQDQKPENVHIKRTSLKYRNPENAPDSLEFLILNKYQKIKAEGGDLIPQLVQINQTTHYFKPIVVQQACLSCHGQSEINSEVFQKIKDTRYSRIPIFEKNLDTIKGIIFIKDILIYKTLTVCQVRSLRVVELDWLPLAGQIMS